MAERKATNKYYPPDWDPEKGSVNRHAKSHPLRARAKKLDEGILVVRFEMPFNIWCNTCNNHVGMGVRYNAEKLKIGNYYTTPIYRFRMKCHLCDNHYEIDTVPSKFDYMIFSGARRQSQCKVEESDISVEGGTNELGAQQTTADAMSSLEKRLEDTLKAEAQQPSLLELQTWRSRWRDDHSMNRLARKQFRERRKRLVERKNKDKQLLKKSSLDIPLARRSSKDRIEAKRLLRQTLTPHLVRQEELKKANLVNSSLKYEISSKSI